MLDAWGVPEDLWVAVDKLEVTVPGVTGANLEGAIVEKTIAALAERLEAIIGPPGRPRTPPARPANRTLFAEVLYFLERGVLFWRTTGGEDWLASAENAVLSATATESAARWREPCSVPRRAGDSSGTLGRARFAARWLEVGAGTAP